MVYAKWFELAKSCGSAGPQRASPADASSLRPACTMVWKSLFYEWTSGVHLKLSVGFTHYAVRILMNSNRPLLPRTKSESALMVSFRERLFQIGVSPRDSLSINWDLFSPKGELALCRCGLFCESSNEFGCLCVIVCFNWKVGYFVNYVICRMLRLISHLS